MNKLPWWLALRRLITLDSTPRELDDSWVYRLWWRYGNPLCRLKNAIQCWIGTHHWRDITGVERCPRCNKPFRF